MACLALASAPAFAQEKPKQPETLRFTFGWKPGLRIEAETISARQRSGQQGMSATLRHAMVTEAAGKALRVRFTDFAVVEAPEQPRIGVEDMRSLADLLASGVPDLLLDPEGTITRVENIERQQATIRALMNKAISAEAQKAAGPAFAKLMEMLTSPALLESKASDTWNPIVATWAGAELEVGETYTQDVKMPMPVLPGTEIQMKTEFTVIGTEPCDRAGRTRRCAVVQVRQVPEPKDLQRVIGELLNQLVPPAQRRPDMSLTMNMETRTRLLTEPDGLFPHGYWMEKVTEMSVSGARPENGMKQVQTQKVTYSYP
jgi:hypothetical protein